MTPYILANTKSYVCDCKSNVGVAYYPKEKGCYTLYREEPCGPNEHFYPPKRDNDSAYCAPRVCRLEYEVYFAGGCHSYRTFNFRNSAYLHQININEVTMELECRKHETFEFHSNYTVVPDENCVDPEAYRIRMEEAERRRNQTTSIGGSSAGGFIDAPRSTSIQYGTQQNCPKMGSKRNLMSICKRLV